MNVSIKMLGTHTFLGANAFSEYLIEVILEDGYDYCVSIYISIPYENDLANSVLRALKSVKFKFLYNMLTYVTTNQFLRICSIYLGGPFDLPALPTHYNHVWGAQVFFESLFKNICEEFDYPSIVIRMTRRQVSS